jgi:hypothetical protein
MHGMMWDRRGVGRRRLGSLRKKSKANFGVESAKFLFFGMNRLGTGVKEGNGLE